MLLSSSFSTSSTPSTVSTLLVTEVRYLALGVLGLTLQRVPHSGNTEPLPRWEAGAHIDIVLPSGATRSYSLCGDPSEVDCYRIAVLHDVNGRGGSAEIHQTQLVGQTLKVIGPRNTFVLVPATHYVFIAGGIGITPLLPMIKAAIAQGRSWELHYLGRSRASMAFLDTITASAQATETVNPTVRPTVNVSARDQDPRFDADAVLAAAPRASTVYCCGPERLLAAVDAACVANEQPLYVEHFGRPTLAPVIDAALPSASSESDAAARRRPNGAAPDGDTEIDPDEGFQVVLQRSGATVNVGPGESILEAVRHVRRDLTFSCSSGYCGTCETRVLGGIPAHRDEVLSDDEKAMNQSMMICVGRSCTKTLVLDL